MHHPAESLREQLKQWGPEAAYERPSMAQAESYCNALATSHYENFHVVSWLLPKHLRQHFYNIYAYCRWSDDLADETGSTVESTRLLQWWEGELKRAYAGTATHPVFVALRSTIEKYQLPQQPFADLLSAFQQDQVKLRYRTDEELLDYCQRSANPVGYLVLALAESVNAENIAWSDAICSGLQIANFCQDIAIDAGKNRIYIPETRLQQYGISESDVLRTTKSENLQQLLREWCRYADSFFDQGSNLVRHVPSWLSLDVRLFIAGGREILKEIERNRYDVWGQRVSLNKYRKLSLVARSTWGWWFGGNV
jgi:squalene synthase HpnC